MTSALTILKRSFRPIEIPATPGPADRAPFSGVYLLIRGDRIAYVGASLDIHRRLYAHGWKRRSRKRCAHVDRKCFSRAMWLPLPHKEVGVFEGALIRALTPRQNLFIPQWPRRHDAAILYWLGLRDELTTDHIDWQEVA